jgi:hypothetical protein
MNFTLVKWDLNPRAQTESTTILCKISVPHFHTTVFNRGAGDELSRRGIFNCPFYAFNTNNGGSLTNHVASCRKKRKLQGAAVAAAAKASAAGTQTHDEQGRILWFRDHHDVCENCSRPGAFLLCSYCNTSWHLRCTAEAFSEPPDGYWACALCVQAEKNGEDMMDHDLERGDDAVDGADFDRSGYSFLSTQSLQRRLRH